MARPKKDHEKQKDASVPQYVSVEEFIRTRDAVVTGLSTLQSAVSDLSRAYISNTNAVLGRGSAPSINQLNFTDQLGGENGFFSARGLTPAPHIETQTKKRKRAPPDKDAPKRPLTPYFLFLQIARSKIAEEMGPGHTAKEVQDEGGRRWREMPNSEKEKWAELYGINFARYKEVAKAYRAKQPLPDISDAQAKHLYEQAKKSAKIQSPTPVKSGHTSEEDSDTSDDGSSDDESPEPEKSPSPAPAAKKQKLSKAARKKAALAAEPDPILDPALRSPVTKRTSKKSAKAAEEAPVAKKAVTEAASPPAKSEKQKKKKRKSAATDY
ncbi:MAG: hypothetical protein Q9163_004684 [Psora crenata]